MTEIIGDYDHSSESGIGRALKGAGAIYEHPGFASGQKYRQGPDKRRQEARTHIAVEAEARKSSSKRRDLVVI